MSESWIHPALEVDEAHGKGKGVYTSVDLEPGVTIGIPSGGRMWTEAEMIERHDDWGDYFHQVDDDRFWGPSHKGDIDTLDILNHSCGPNVGWEGDMRLVTLKYIRRGTELCWDYATSESWEGYGFRCTCGARNCRRRMTTLDWLRPELQVNLHGHFMSYLQKKIDAKLARRNLALQDNGLYYIDRYSKTTEHWHRIFGNHQGILAEIQSPYQLIQVFQTSYGRMLVLDGNLQIATLDEEKFAEPIVLAGLVACDSGKLTVLILGDGDGGILKQILKDPRVIRVILVDIDPDVDGVAQKHLREICGNSFEDPRVTVVHMDALEFLEGTPYSFDLIMIDLNDSSESAHARRVMTRKFFTLLYDRLLSRGVAVLQASQLTDDNMKEHNMCRELMAGVFPSSGQYEGIASFRFDVPSFSAMWSGIVGKKDGILPYAQGNTVIRDHFLRKRTRPLLSLTAGSFAAMFEFPERMKKAFLPRMEVIQPRSDIL